MKKVSNGIVTQRKLLFLFPLFVIALGAFLAPYAVGASTAYTVSFVSVGTYPAGLAYDSGKGEMFVANSHDGTVSVINETSHAVIKTIDVGGSTTSPGLMAYDSVKGEIFVTVLCTDYLFGFPLQHACVKVINDATNTVVATISLPIPFAYATGIAYDWGKGTIYVATSVWPTTGDQYATSLNNITVISDATNTIIKNITDPSLWRPGALLYDPARGAIFVANTAPDRTSPYYKISVINDALNSVVATINVGSSASYAQPSYMAYDPGKSEIFVTELYTGNVAVISDADYHSVANISVYGQPGGIAYDSANGQMFVANTATQSVQVISDATNTVVANVTALYTPTFTAYDTHTGEVYVSSYFTNQVAILHPIEESTTSTVTKTVTTTVTSTTTITSHQTTTVTTTSIPPPVTITSTQTTTTTLPPETTTVTSTSTSTITEISTSTQTVTSPTTITETSTTTSTTTLPPETTTVTTTSISTVTSTSVSTTTSTSISTTTSTSTQTVGAASISLNCSPSSVTLGKNVRCVATATAGYPPAGNIAFSNTPGSGTFGTPSCTTRTNTLSCSVAYTPSVPGPQQVNATYSGDPNFLTVSASTMINVKSASALAMPVGVISGPIIGSFVSIYQGIAGGLASISQASLAGVTSAVFIVAVAALVVVQRLRLLSYRRSRNQP